MGNKLINLVLEKTYYEKGFFNVRVEASDLIRNDEGTINIFLDHSTSPLIARVDRNSNLNKTPRIFGGAILKTWFQTNFKLGDIVKVEIIDPFNLRMERNQN